MKKSIFVTVLLLTALLFTEKTYAATATSSSKSIDEEVKKRIDEIKNSPKAYVGVVTDKSQNTLQLKTEKGEIELISVDLSATVFVKVAAKSTTSKFDDVAIGDFIIAIGFKNGNDILNAKRVLISTAPEAPTRKIVGGKILSIVKKTVTIETKSAKYELKFPKTWQGPEIKDLSTGDSVLVVGEVDESTITLRSIFKI